MKANIFDASMSPRDMFIAYLDASDQGLFESGNFFVTDEDFQSLLKVVLLKGSWWRFDKNEKRVWTLFMRELVFRYARQHKSLWPDLKDGFQKEIQKLLPSLTNEERRLALECQRSFGDLQGFCYGNLRNIFKTGILENSEYWFSEYDVYSRRFLGFLFKIAVLPSNYMPEHDIYGRLRDAYVDSLRPYYVGQNLEDVFFTKLRWVLGDGDAWNLHENTLEAFRDRLLEFFTLVFSWRTCGYSLEEAKEELEQSFDFLSLESSVHHYLRDFLREEFCLSEGSVPDAKTQKVDQNVSFKKMLHIDSRFYKERNEFHFVPSRDNIYSAFVSYVSIVGNVDKNITAGLRIRKPISISTVCNDALASITINGKLLVAGESLADRNQSFLKLFMQERINVKIGNILELENIDNPWYRDSLWFLQNAYGEAAATWNISKNAYLIYPLEYGPLNIDESGLYSEGITRLDAESHASGMHVYKFMPNSNYASLSVNVKSTNEYGTSIALSDASYIRCREHFQGSPAFVQQNLHSKMGIGSIKFICSSYDADKKIANELDGVKFVFDGDTLVIENISNDIKILGNESQIIANAKSCIQNDCRFPKMVLLPKSARIWITMEDRALMGHWWVDSERKGAFAISNGIDSITVQEDGSIHPCRWDDSWTENKFKLIRPEWNGLLAESNCSSNQLELTSAWFSPFLEDANLYFRWDEGKLHFEVSLSPEDRSIFADRKIAEGFAGLYRVLQINGAKLECGWEYQGERFVKTFGQAEDYAPPSRPASIVRNAPFMDVQKLGEQLKNSIVVYPKLKALWEYAVIKMPSLEDRHVDLADFESEESLKDFLKKEASKLSISQKCEQYNLSLRQDGLGCSLDPNSFNTIEELDNAFDVVYLCEKYNREYRIVSEERRFNPRNFKSVNEVKKRFLLLQNDLIKWKIIQRKCDWCNSLSFMKESGYVFEASSFTSAEDVQKKFEELKNVQPLAIKDACQQCNEKYLLSNDKALQSKDFNSIREVDDFVLKNRKSLEAVQERALVNQKIERECVEINEILATLDSRINAKNYKSCPVEDSLSDDLKIKLRIARLGLNNESIFIDERGIKLESWLGRGCVYLSYPLKWGALSHVNRSGVLYTREYVIEPRYYHEDERKKVVYKIQISGLDDVSLTTERGNLFTVPMKLLRVKLKSDTLGGMDVVGNGCVTLKNYDGIDLSGGAAECEVVDQYCKIKNSGDSLITIPPRRILCSQGIIDCPQIIIYPSGVQTFTAKWGHDSYFVQVSDSGDVSVEKSTKNLETFKKKGTNVNASFVVDLTFRFLEHIAFDGKDAGICLRIAETELEISRIEERKNLELLLMSAPPSDKNVELMYRKGGVFYYNQFDRCAHYGLNHEKESMSDVALELQSDSYGISRDWRDFMKEMQIKSGIMSVLILQECVKQNVVFGNKTDLVLWFYNKLAKMMRPSERNVFNVLYKEGPEYMQYLFRSCSPDSTIFRDYLNSMFALGAYNAGFRMRRFMQDSRMQFKDFEGLGYRTLISAYYEGIRCGMRLRKTAAPRHKGDVLDSFACALDWDAERTILRSSYQSLRSRAVSDWLFVLPLSKEMPPRSVMMDLCSKIYAKIQEMT